MSRRANRASRYEMTQREEKVLDLGVSKDVFTIQDIQKTLGMPYPRAAAVANTLLNHGKLELVGRDARKYQLRLTPDQRTRWAARAQTPTPPVADETWQEEQQEKDPPVRNLPDVSVDKVLAQLHIGLGGELRVKGFHLVEGELPSIDLESEDGEVINVAIIRPSL